MSPCRSCGVEMIWARSKATGKWMPVEKELVPGGNVRLISGQNYADGVPRAYVVGPEEAEGGATQLGFDEIGGEEKPLGYVSHFANCPASEEWRRS